MGGKGGFCEWHCGWRIASTTVATLYLISACMTCRISESRDSSPSAVLVDKVAQILRALDIAFVHADAVIGGSLTCLSA